MRHASAEQKGAALKAASRLTGVGFSLGISPWTDHGLFRTFSEKKRRVTIIVGHDWYPIVPSRAPNRQHPVDMPLWAQGVHETAKYHDTVPQSLLDATPEDGDVLLFVNLVPDYRPPGASTTGRFPDYDYTIWLDGFTAMVESVCRRYEGNVSLISWGVPVWTLLAANILGQPRVPLLSHHTRGAQGTPLAFRAGDFSVQYIPTAHPSKHLNIQKDFHLLHVEKGFDQLRLGPPGVSPQEANRRRRLREVL